MQGVVLSERSPSYRYWQAIDPAERERIEAAIPPDLRLHIFPGHRAKPGTANVGLRYLDGRAAGAEVRGRLTAALCWSALRSAA